jgi:hypothetical protein
MTTTATTEALNNLPHEWHYGSTTAWRDYSYRLTLRLNCSGIPAKREFRTYYEDPATARWVVTFPATYFDRATQIADGLNFPSNFARTIKGKPVGA